MQRNREGALDVAFFQQCLNLRDCRIARPTNVLARVPPAARCDAGDDQYDGQDNGSLAGRIAFATNTVGGQVECPGQDKSRHKTNDENQKNKLGSPVRQFENVGKEVSNLQQHPRRDNVGGTNAQDLASPQLSQKTRHAPSCCYWNGAKIPR